MREQPTVTISVDDAVVLLALLRDLGEFGVTAENVRLLLRRTDRLEAKLRDLYLPGELPS